MPDEKGPRIELSRMAAHQWTNEANSLQPRGWTLGRWRHSCRASLKRASCPLMGTVGSHEVTTTTTTMVYGHGDVLMMMMRMMTTTVMIMMIDGGGGDIVVMTIFMMITIMMVMVMLLTVSSALLLHHHHRHHHHRRRHHHQRITSYYTVVDIIIISPVQVDWKWVCSSTPPGQKSCNPPRLQCPTRTVAREELSEPCREAEGSRILSDICSRARFSERQETIVCQCANAIWMFDWIDWVIDRNNNNNNNNNII